MSITVWVSDTNLFMEILEFPLLGICCLCHLTTGMSLCRKKRFISLHRCIHDDSKYSSIIIINAWTVFMCISSDNDNEWREQEIVCNFFKSDCEYKQTFRKVIRTPRWICPQKTRKWGYLRILKLNKFSLLII